MEMRNSIRPCAPVSRGALRHFQRPRLLFLEMGGQTGRLDTNPARKPGDDRADESDDCLAGFHLAKNQSGANEISLLPPAKYYGLPGTALFLHFRRFAFQIASVLARNKTASSHTFGKVQIP